MKQKKTKQFEASKPTGQRTSKLESILEARKQQNRQFLATVESIKVSESIRMSLEAKVEEECKKEQQNVQYVSAKWLIGLKSNLSGECDITYQVEPELGQIVKLQLRERIAKQKELQKKQYQSLLEELKLVQRHQMWDDKISEDFKCSYQYQSQGKVVSIDIKYYGMIYHYYLDILKLNPHNYVNDTIINFFLRFIENEIVKSQALLIFNTYFCAKLMTLVNDSKALYEQYLLNNAQLLKWTKDDVFTKQYLLFPLHLREHWAVLIVVNPLSVCEAMLQKYPKTQGYILYLDSLLLLDPRIELLVKFYLLQVYNSFNKQLTNEQIYDVAIHSSFKANQPIIPKQTNLVDCGMYMLEYVERFLCDPDRILLALNKDHLNWFPRVIIFIKRILIKKILIGLSEDMKDNAERYLNNCRQIDNHYKGSEQFQVIDECLLEQVQMSRLQFHLSEEYNYFDEISGN